MQEEEGEDEEEEEEEAEEEGAEGEEGEEEEVRHLAVLSFLSTGMAGQLGRKASTIEAASVSLLDFKPRSSFQMPSIHFQSRCNKHATHLCTPLPTHEGNGTQLHSTPVVGTMGAG